MRSGRNDYTEDKKQFFGFFCAGSEPFSAASAFAVGTRRPTQGIEGEFDCNRRYGCPSSAARTRHGVSGISVTSAPIAFATAFAIAGATPMIGGSASPFTPM